MKMLYKLVVVVGSLFVLSPSNLDCMRSGSSRIGSFLLRGVRVLVQNFDYTERDGRLNNAAGPDDDCTKLALSKAHAPYEFMRNGKFYKSEQGERLAGTWYFCHRVHDDPFHENSFCEQFNQYTLFRLLLFKKVLNFCFYDELHEEQKICLLVHPCLHTEKIERSAIAGKAGHLLDTNFFLCVSFPCGYVACAVCAHEFVNIYKQCPCCSLNLVSYVQPNDFYEGCSD